MHKINHCEKFTRAILFNKMPCGLPPIAETNSRATGIDLHRQMGQMGFNQTATDSDRSTRIINKP
jgi:hypothetical protein